MQKNQLKDLPRNKIARKSLDNYGAIIHVKNDKKIVSICNHIGPEHIEILSKNFKKYLNKNIIAGSVCIGPYSSMALSDYGPTQHSLPTISSAKFSSGLSVNDFLKRQSLIKITKSGIERLGPSVINLAKHEKLEGHANSIKIRLKRRG